mmetsp:Transcript_1221/g.1552  ORF Transcript_1221/g.1552 Transcript_1221/m.1552 type:complete len:260 (+) Transcript_1221:822-1601(+)
MCVLLKLRNSFFTINEYIEWSRNNDDKDNDNTNDDDSSENEKKNKKEGFTYYTNWPAFNIPGRIFIDMMDDFRKDTTCLLPRELALLYLLQKNGANIPSFNTCMDTCMNNNNNPKTNSNNSFYVIATCKNDTNSCLAHELSHAFYTTNNNYKKEINEILDQIPDQILLKCYESLLTDGYCNVKEILLDEIHAYLLDSSSFHGNFPFHLKIKFHNKIESIFLKYTGLEGRNALYGSPPCHEESSDESSSNSEFDSEFDSD